MHCNPKINDRTEHVKKTAGRVTQVKERDAEKVKDEDRRKVEKQQMAGPKLTMCGSGGGVGGL